MAKRIGTFRRKTRHLFAKNLRNRGKLPLRKFFQIFETGERVCLVAEPAYQGGLYFRRFHNRVGSIVGKKGACYEVLIKDINKEKKLIIHPVHLRKEN